MKTYKLIWARHGEAGQSSTGDKDRPLTPRGVQQARSLAQQLQKHGWLPQTIFCSAARRTKETLEAMLETWNQEIPHRFEHNFYLGNLTNVQQILSQADLSGCDTILLVGHNPGWSNAPEHLSGSLVSLGTADAALLSIESNSWGTALFSSSAWSLEQILRSSFPMG